MALKPKEHFLFWIIAASVFLIDRIAKFAVVKTLMTGASIPILPFFHITRIHNTGTLFGLLPGAKWFFLILAVAVMLFIILRYAFFIPKIRLALALVLGGAAGNLFDRIAYGYVIDFLDFRIWPAFNFADAAITIAVLLLLFFELCKSGKK
jgi:signal peptidase II